MYKTSTECASSYVQLQFNKTNENGLISVTLQRAQWKNVRFCLVQRKQTQLSF